MTPDAKETEGDKIKRLRRESARRNGARSNRRVKARLAADVAEAAKWIALVKSEPLEGFSTYGVDIKWK